MDLTCFEGVEKKVELVVTTDFPSLRSMDRAILEEFVQAAGAQVISIASNQYCDAYLLSESSMFVYDDYLLMITCGCTGLINAVQKMLQHIPPESIALLFYERKKEYFPEQQASNFLEDVQRLQQWLPGQVVRVGDERHHGVQMFCTSRPYVPDRSDSTLEVLMHDIAPQTAARFTESGIIRRSVLDPLFPGFMIHDHVFSPVGYSRNAVRGEEYYTIHVTPEEAGSYVSFETNFDFRHDLNELVKKITRIFQPRTFDVLTFLPEGESRLSVDGYRLGDHVVRILSGYCVTYFQHIRASSRLDVGYEFAL